MSYGYYPGCSLHSTACEYNHSFQNVCNSLGIDIKEVPKWNCCGSTAAHSTSHLLSIALPLLVTIKAKEHNLNDLLVPCASCFQRLKSAQYEITKSKDLSRKIADILQEDLPSTVNILHPLELFTDKFLSRLKEKIRKDLNGLKVACYYGCLLTRPARIMKFDRAEYPTSMDKIIVTLGGEAIDWNHKTLCCGASLSLTKPDFVARFVKEILSDAIRCGANAISVACPLCHANLDMRQSLIKEVYHTEFNIPIFYFTELMEIATGYNIDGTYLNRHFVSPFRILEEYNLV